MGAVEKFFAGAFGLIALYLVLSDRGAAANNVLGGLGKFNATTFGTLQGRNVTTV